MTNNVTLRDDSHFGTMPGYVQNRYSSICVAGNSTCQVCPCSDVSVNMWCGSGEPLTCKLHVWHPVDVDPTCGGGTCNSNAFPDIARVWYTIRNLYVTDSVEVFDFGTSSWHASEDFPIKTADFHYQTKFGNSTIVVECNNKKSIYRFNTETEGWQPMMTEVHSLSDSTYPAALEVGNLCL